MHKLVAAMASVTIGTVPPLLAQGIEIVEDGTFISVPTAPPVFATPIENKFLSSDVQSLPGLKEDMVAPSKLSVPIESPRMLNVAIQTKQDLNVPIELAKTFNEKIAVPLRPEKPLEEPKPKMRNEVVQALEEEKTIRFSNITFEVGSSRLTAEGRAFVQVIATALIAKPTLNIVISGHTDSTGTDVDNQWLSEARANAIRTALINTHGISASRLKTVGFGESMPIASNTTDAGRALNRRVEITRWN